MNDELKELAALALRNNEGLEFVVARPPPHFNVRYDHEKRDWVPLSETSNVEVTGAERALSAERPVDRRVGGTTSRQGDDMISYVRNCYIVLRDEVPLFIEKDGEIIPQLDGFLIVPREKISDIDSFVKSLNVNSDPAALTVCLMGTGYGWSPGDTTPPFKDSVVRPGDTKHATSNKTGDGFAATGHETLLGALEYEPATEVYLRGEKVFERRNGEWYFTGAGEL